MSDQKNIVLPTNDQIKAGVFDIKDGNSGTPPAQEYKIQPVPQAGYNPNAANAFQAAPGPVIPQDTSVFENPASREELLAKTAELNKEQ